MMDDTVVVRRTEFMVAFRLNSMQVRSRVNHADSNWTAPTNKASSVVATVQLDGEFSPSTAHQDQAGRVGAPCARAAKALAGGLSCSRLPTCRAHGSAWQKG